MAPYLETVLSFADVKTDGGVDTLQFLKAVEGLIGIFDLLGSAAFSVVQADLKGNVAKLRARHDAHPSESDTIEHLVENEHKEKKRPATEGLMWLLRGLSFTCKALQSAQADSTKELGPAFTSSYEGTLKKFHNFVVKGIFAVAMKAVPYRKDFYEKLAKDPEGGPSTPTDKLNTELNKWLDALSKIVTHLETFGETGGYFKNF